MLTAAAQAALARYRDGAPRHPRSYADLHEHVLALARAGLLHVIDEPINKDTEMHPLVRWQYRGGIAEADRKAFLFTQPTDAKGRRYDMAVLVAGLAANRDVLPDRLRQAARRDRRDLGAGDRQSDRAAAHHAGAMSGDRDQRPRSRSRRPGARRIAGADLDAGLRQRALSLRRPLHHQGSGYRHPERRQLPRPAQGTAAARDEPVGRAARRHLCALAQAPRARRAAALRRGGGLPAGHLLCFGAEDAGGPRRARGGGGARGRPDQRDARADGRSAGAGRGRDRHRGLDRYAASRAGSAVRRVARLCEPAGIQCLHGGDGDHAARPSGAAVLHQPGDAERIRA